MERFALCTLLALLLPVKCLYAGDSCMADDQAATCVRLSECKPLLDEIKRAGRPMPMHIRMKLNDRSCGFEEEEPLICCIPSAGNTDPVTTNPLSRDEIPPDTSKRMGGVPDIQNHPNLHLLPTKNCGISDTERVFGGNRTRLFEIPWMVLLSYDSPRARRLSCGGTLINERYVLTAAHCVTFLGNTLKFTGVVLGDWDVRDDPDCERVEGGKKFCALSAKNVSVEQVIAHTGYSPQTLVDDIALLRLSEPADLTSVRIRPVCLPVTPELQNEDLDGQMGVVSGWGADDGLQSPVLLYAELPIVGNKECQDAYKGQPPIYSSQICAGGVINKDTCAGNSEGPLLFYGNIAGTKGTRYIQRGIVSYGSRTCGIGLPTVYTRTAYYMDWILDHIHE